MASAARHMIRFSCKCSNPFEVPEDMAGGQMQCTKCGRLNDVPTLHDLANLNEDGTYRVGAKVVDPQANRMPELKRVYGHDKTEADGRDIDLRPTPAEVAAAGTEYPAFDLVQNMHVSPPKYDPVTGELIRPMTIRPDEALDTPASQIPVAVPVLGYASGHTLSGGGEGAHNPFVALLSPINLFVMFIMFIMHAICIELAVAKIGLAGVVVVWFIILLTMVVWLSHYGMVLEEMATEARDDLPRPLRNAQLYEDVLRPFFHEITSIVLCYWPVMVMILAGRQHRMMLMAESVFLLAGSFFFPAVLLTAVTSGSFWNLSPPRVWGVIASLGRRYAIYALFFVLTALVYLLGLSGGAFGLDQTIWVITGKTPPAVFGRAAGYLTLATGIYLMHAFCWIMGLAYQRHHVEFPWVLQRHIPDPNRQPPLPRKKPRYVKPA